MNNHLTDEENGKAMAWEKVLIDFLKEAQKNVTNMTISFMAEVSFNYLKCTKINIRHRRGFILKYVICSPVTEILSWIYLELCNLFIRDRSYTGYTFNYAMRGIVS